MFATFQKAQQNDPHLDAIERLKTWTRERFELERDAPVFASEVSCALPGCPPLETIVGFWTSETQRHHFKIFKPVAEVQAEDLPPRWLRDALVVGPEVECSC